MAVRRGSAPDFSSPSLSLQEFDALVGEEGKTANKETRNRERGPVEADSGCGGRTRVANSPGARAPAVHCNTLPSADDLRKCGQGKHDVRGRNAQCGHTGARDSRAGHRLECAPDNSGRAALKCGGSGSDSARNFLLPARRGAALEKCADQEASWRGMLHPTSGGAAFVAFAYRVDVKREPEDAATLFQGTGQAHLQTVMQTKQCVTAPRHRAPFSRRPTFWLSMRATAGPESIGAPDVGGAPYATRCHFVFRLAQSML
ncbi:hypothetical protein HPB50_017655 [Hyalomma asiaticum]|uniref:Uncharacterized protein n=1 Tax=Hyalomma asiaticum TaxID=266040 RepID=A0ACB7TLX6_HYAAI|nr:hypothetical protein HPB50_017655 [Hyalomma asiaticum]